MGGGAYQELLKLALKRLTRREYSYLELSSYLLKNSSEDLVQQVMDYLVTQKYQSDERYAQMICRVRARDGKGPVLIKYELSTRGVSKVIIDSVLKEYVGEWQKIAEQARVKKYGTQLPKNYSEYSRQLKFLQGRGFSPEHIASFTS